MNKLQVQQRVLQNGKPIDLDKFEWNEEVRSFSTKEDNLIIDFTGSDNCTFTTGSGCIFTTWSGCTFTTKSSCTFTTRSDCIFTTKSDCTFTTEYDCTFTTGSDCVIVNRNVFEVIQPEEGKVIQICPHGIAGHLIDGKLDGVPHIIADGILSKIISKKGNIYKVINHGDDKRSYLIERQDGDKKVYSHGKTLKEARDSLIYKISDRDTSNYESMTLDTILTKEECIAMYRTITGACEEGTKYFVESKDKVKKKYKISEIIEATKGQFGNESLVKFFKDE